LQLIAELGSTPAQELAIEIGVAVHRSNRVEEGREVSRCSAYAEHL
jgi:hypothetical protein